MMYVLSESQRPTLFFFGGAKRKFSIRRVKPEREKGNLLEENNNLYMAGSDNQQQIEVPWQALGSQDRKLVLLPHYSCGKQQRYQ